ncbi:MAG: FapA family protein [Oscillospiraceae bacterium]|jgi:uncharacterized protein (DUF342 family)|nr:FapA family protein [Oscillospiraceae bacterium]
MDESGRLPVHAKVSIQVTADRRTANAVASAPQNGGNPLAPETVMAALNEAGVVFGINMDVVNRLCRGAYDRPHPIAAAVMPVRGEAAKIAYHFTAERELKPRELEDGTVDYKDLGLITGVNAGDVLCTKTPAAEGVDGTNVLGESIPAQPGKDVKMPMGPGTKLSDDGLRLLAATSGQVSVVKNRVTVSDLYTVEEDVGVGTGNIDFAGNVRVRGNVTLGFKVKATGSVTVNGMMDGGSVEAGGNVSVDNGFNGMSSGEIVSGGDVRCKYLQNGKVSAKGNIYTGLIIGCTVRSGDKLQVAGAKSQIYNSALSARTSISCVNVGTTGNSRPVTLEVGSDPEITQRKTNNPKEIAETEKKLKSIEMLYNVYAEREKRGILPADKVKEYESVKNTRGILQSALEGLYAERDEIEEQMSSMGYGTVIILGNITEGTHVVIGAERYVVPAPNKFVRFTRTAEGIVSAPAR